MAYLETLYTDLRAAVAATWTDVAADGIWEGEHQAMIPWADLTAPYAAIVIPELPVSPDWGLANQVYEGEIFLYYVGEITGDSDPIRAKLEALRTALLVAGVLTAGCVLDVTKLTWSDDLEANQIFQDKDYTHRAGRLGVRVLVGEFAT